MHTDLASYIYTFSYLGIFLWFAIGEQLTPVPEEIYLISLGYISKHAGLDPFIAVLVAVLGLLATDNFLFYISMKGNRFSNKLLEKVKGNLLLRVKKNIKENAIKTLIVMGLLPKLRFLSPIISGVTGISWKMFLVVNSIVTAFYVTVYILLGILFHDQLQVLVKKIQPVQHIIFVVFMIILAVVLVIMIKKWVTRDKQDPGEPVLKEN